MNNYEITRQVKNQKITGTGIFASNLLPLPSLTFLPAPRRLNQHLNFFPNSSFSIHSLTDLSIPFNTVAPTNARIVPTCTSKFPLLLASVILTAQFSPCLSGYSSSFFLKVPSPLSSQQNLEFLKTPSSALSPSHSRLSLMSSCPLCFGYQLLTEDLHTDMSSPHLSSQAVDPTSMFNIYGTSQIRMLTFLLTLDPPSGVPGTGKGTAMHRFRSQKPWSHS